MVGYLEYGAYGHFEVVVGWLVVVVDPGSVRTGDRCEAHSTLTNGGSIIY